MQTRVSVSMEFSLNAFTEFTEFSDKKNNQKGRLQGWNPGSPV